MTDHPTSGYKTTYLGLFDQPEPCAFVLEICFRRKIPLALVSHPKPTPR